jgi:cell division protein FtsB
MLDFQQKRKLRSFIYNRITLLVLVILVVLVMYSTFGVWQKKQASEELKDAADKRLLELGEKYADLEKDIKRLNTREGVEEEIRSKFSVAKEGENMVVIVNDIEDEDLSSTTKTSLWQSFINLFK